MLFYIVLWGFFAIGLLLNKKNYSDTIMMMFFFIISVFVGYRFDVGADWVSYVSVFQYEAAELSGTEILTYEPLYYLSNIVFNKLGFSHCQYLLIINFAVMCCLYKAMKNLNVGNTLISWIIYVSLYFCMLNLNIVRQGVMVSLIYLAVSYLLKQDIPDNKIKKRFLIIMLIAAGFHYFTIVFFLLIPLLLKGYSKKLYLFGILLGYFLLITDFTGKYLPQLSNAQLFFSIITNKMGSYFGGGYDTTETVSIGLLFNTFLIVVTRFIYPQLYIGSKTVSFLANCMLLNIFMIGFFASSSIFAERFSNSLNVAIVFLFPILFEKLSSKKNRYFLLILIFSYSLLYYHKLIYTPGSDFKPYEFYPFIVNFNQ